jgi:hypothetical protein
MRITKILFLIILCNCYASSLSAANRFWIGVLSGNWSNTLNWSANSGGLGGASAPSTSDIAIFDGGFLGLDIGSCTIDIPVSVTGITVNSAYSGAIIQGANTIIVSGAASFGGGTFTGGSANITIGSTFTISATAFTSTSAILELRGDAAFTGGSFAHHNGWTRFNDAAAQNTTGISPAFFDLEFVGRGNSYTLSSTGNIGVANSLNISGTASCALNTGSLNVNANIVLTNTATGDGGTGTINITGTTNQAILSALPINQSTLPSVNINKSGGTLTLPTLITVMGNWTYTMGTIDAATNNSTVAFDNTLTITGTHTLDNIIFEGGNNWTITIAATTTLTASGDISITGANNMVLNTGTINLNGNLNLTNTATGGGGTAIIDFIGTTNQAINSALLINQSNLPAVTINKTSGTLTFPALITVCGNWTYTAGTMDVTTNNSTVVFARTLGIAGNSHTLNNVTFEGNNNWTFTVNTGTILTVTGTLTTSGTSNVFINAAVVGATVIQAQGDININNSSATGGGQGLILINGTGPQTFTSTAATSHGLLPYIKIQKISGTLTMNGIISESRDWTYLSGVVAPTTSTVVFGGNSLSVTSAGMNFNNVAVTTNVTTLLSDMSVKSNLTISGTAILAAGANTINLSGNWTNWGTGGFSESASTVNLNGSALQTITAPGGENFTNLTVNNSGPGVQLVNNTTVATTLNMTLGNIDLNGNVLTLGLTIANNGTLAWTSGTIINTGSFTRWFKAAVIPSGSAAGLFPVGTAADYRPVFISAPVTPPATGGTVTVAYTNATTNSVVSISDLPFTVVLRKDLNWAITTSGITGGLYNMQIQGTDYGLIGAVSDLRLTLMNAVVGAAGVNAGTTANPQVNRTGLTAANLSNSFFLGSIDAVSSPLPVTLVSFTAFLSNQKVDLKWETATETGNDYFTVLRSKDGIAWAQVQRVDGKGTSDNNTYYEIFDGNPLSGISYYKLENTDFDGHVYFSPVMMINSSESSDEISVYPNPTSDNLVVLHNGNESFTIEVLNNMGQLVMRIPGNKSPKTMDVSSLPGGVYFVQILFSGKRLTTKVVIR